ncbi:sulfotransferase 1B1-like [Haliotis rufescens]|uniref:sulfotransferase 1B1-like n=1 Tax=Haliotis rufescens TaxID=6454 RepID=UPI00201F7CE1|nr:sulfotransferase 1B1-like [Haliotis rufescens]XP_046351459.2 sulfotransferase 1B1-like [Haliotis rufescens]
MSVKKVPDAAGCTLTLLDVDGRMFPTFPADVIRGVPNLKLRDDDILISGYPKSGTHWLFEVSRVLLSGSCDVGGMEKDDLMIEMKSHDHLAKMASPRILNTHVQFDSLPKEIHQKKTKIIYLLRNPKDAAVSFYNHHRKLVQYYDYHGIFKDYLPLWVEGKVDYGSWFDYVRSWQEGLTRHPDVPSISVVYEDMKEDALSQIRRISQFLGLSHDDAFLRKVDDWCSFKRMRERKGKHDMTSDGQPVMYRKGEVGDWKNWFTVADNEWFDQVFTEKMTDLDLSLRYTI